MIHRLTSRSFERLPQWQRPVPRPNGEQNKTKSPSCGDAEGSTSIAAFRFHDCSRTGAQADDLPPRENRALHYPPGALPQVPQFAVAARKVFSGAGRRRRRLQRGRSHSFPSSRWWSCSWCLSSHRTACQGSHQTGASPLPSHRQFFIPNIAPKTKDRVAEATRSLLECLLVGA